MNEIWTNFIYPTMSLFALGFIYLTIKNLLPSYFSEKGKNIATREDISEITELVEQVKHEFTNQTEQLKSKLNVISNVHVDLAIQERNAIVECNIAYFSWLNLLIDSNLGGIDDSKDENLLDYRQKIQVSYRNFKVDQTKFDLFIDDDELIILLNEMSIATLKNLGALITQFTFAIEGINNERKNLKETYPNYSQTDYQEILEKQKKLHSDLTQNIIKGYKEIVDLNKDFQKMCRKKLYEILEKNQ